MEESNIVKEIEKVVALGQQIMDRKDFSCFEHYVENVTIIGKRVFLLRESDNYIGLVISLLELKLEYSWYYKFFVIGKIHRDFLQNWKNEGKYLYYIECSLIMLNAIIYNLRK